MSTETARDYVRRLSLNEKLIAMMLLLSLSILSVFIFLYAQTEKAMYREFESQTAELSKAIQVGVEEVTSSGATDEKRLQNYLKKLNTRGVKEISVISNSDKIISSTDPRNIGKWLTTKRKELIFKAQLGEPVTGEGHAYNVIIPVVAENKHYGYIHLTINTEDFSTFMRERLLQRIVAAALVLAAGTFFIVFLARKYTRPIEDVVHAARRVAGGDLTQELKSDRQDEIGELTQSFNYMIRKLREERELEERLRKAEHLAGIGQFSRSIAHEIRNPLNFISLSIDHIREKYRPADSGSGSAFDSLIRNIKGEIQRVSRFAESFLEYGKPLELNRQEVEILGIIDGVLELVQAKAEKEQIAIVRDYEAGPLLFVDTEFIKTCLYNIILNAFQAMPAGGTITVSTITDEGRFRISVADTGAGIPKEKLPKIFDPFFTTKAGGLGLGLPLTKRIVEEHGGRVDITSAEGGGTTVTISLPAAEERVHAGHSGR
ncbi:MAG: HAMP domain-containing sensor histidine kinase [Thermodesulfovibrionales bacterium]